MPSDPKRRGKRTPKPTFHGNRYTKKVRIDCNETTESVESDKEVNSDQECSKSDESKPETQTTPTRSAMKLYNMYGVSKSVCDFPEDSRKEYRSHDNLQQDLADRRMANPMDPVLNHHTSQERQPAAMPELPNNKPHQSPKQSHAEDHTEQIEATSGENHR